MAVVDVAEELSILVYDVDTLIVLVCYQDSTLAVCGDAGWIKRSLGSKDSKKRPKTRVGKPKVTELIDNHNCTCSIVSYTNIQVAVLTNVFNETTR